MKRLLIVDDELLVRIGLKSIVAWEEYGYTVVGEAADGGEALAKIGALEPDIVFTDLYMDNMDGFELIAQCAKQFPWIKCVVLSNYNDFESVKRAMKLGAVDYVFKLTSNPKDLLKLLDETSARIDSEKGGREDDGSSRLLRKNIPAIKSNLFKNAIQQNYLSYQDLMREFTQLKLATDFSSPYIVLYISVDDFSKTSLEGGIPDLQLLKFSMENMIQEVLKENTRSETYNYDNGDLIAIVGADEKEEGMDKGELVQAITHDFDTIRTYMKRYLGVRVSACVSAPCCGIEMLRDAVGEAERKLYQRLPNESEKLYFCEGGIRDEIVRVKQYVHAHLQEELGVARLAQAVNMSESYFSHMFKRDVGMSLTDYVNRVRIARSKELLEKSELKINEIAELVGFHNTNYFSTLFKKMTGKSPNQIRMK